MSYQRNYPNGWQSGEAGGTPITPETLNNMENGIANALPKDGTDPMTADLPMGGHRVTDVGNPVEDGDAVPLGYAGQHFAPAGYGWGGDTVNATSADDINANGYYETGVYMGSSKESCVIWHNQHSANYAEQVATSIYGNHVGTTIRRVKSKGTWGEWEYVNPPMVVAVEYRTTERCNGKVVYTQYVDMGSLPNAGAAHIALNCAVESYPNFALVDYRYQLVYENYRSINPTKLTLSNTGSIFWSVVSTGTQWYAYVKTDFDASSATATGQIWYTKD